MTTNVSRAKDSLDRAIDMEIKLAFESKTVPEVRAMEAKTRENIELKKQGLSTADVVCIKKLPLFFVEQPQQYVLNIQ